MREGTPTQWSFTYDTPDPSRMCIYVCEEMRKRDRLGKKTVVARTGTHITLNFTHIKVNPRMTSTPGFAHGSPLHHHCPYEKGILLFSRPTTWRYSGGFKEEARGPRHAREGKREKNYRPLTGHCFLSFDSNLHLAKACFCWLIRHT